MTYAWSVHDNFATIAGAIMPAIFIAGQITPAITPVIVIAGQIAPAITLKLHWIYGTITVKFALPGFRTTSSAL